MAPGKQCNGVRKWVHKNTVEGIVCPQLEGALWTFNNALFEHIEKETRE